MGKRYSAYILAGRHQFLYIDMKSKMQKDGKFNE